MDEHFQLFSENMAILYIPEENRSVDLLELSEWPDLLQFHEKTLKLYSLMCALGNYRVAHSLCRLVGVFLVETDISADI